MKRLEFKTTAVNPITGEFVWVRVTSDVVSEGAALAMLNGYVVLNGWQGANIPENYRIVEVDPNMVEF